MQQESGEFPQQVSLHLLGLTIWQFVGIIFHLDLSLNLVGDSNDERLYFNLCAKHAGTLN